MKTILIFLFSFPINLIVFAIKLIFCIFCVLAIILIVISIAFGCLLTTILEKLKYDSDSSETDGLMELLDYLLIFKGGKFWKWRKYYLKKD